jgi:hypothetical protein
MILNPNKKSKEEIMKRVISIRLAIALMALCLPLISNSASAQQEKGKESVTTEQKLVVAYRIEFNVREIEEGKPLNSRKYMMVVEDGKWGKIRVGSRVPYQAGEKQYQYVDVGMNIDCLPREREDNVTLVVNVEFSSVATQSQTAPTFNPVLRTERTEVASTVKPGKPTLVASMEDVESKRTYEIEVTATKVK